MRTALDEQETRALLTQKREKQGEGDGEGEGEGHWGQLISSQSSHLNPPQPPCRAQFRITNPIEAS